MGHSLVDRLKAIPGAATVSAASIVPLGGHEGNFFSVEGGRQLGRDEKTPVTLQIAALPGYVETMGITLLGGRGFTERDSIPGSPRVVIVNASFATYFWGNTAVVGKRIRYGNRGNDWMEVVGVIADIHHYGRDGVMRPSVLVPYSIGPRPAMTIAMRGAVDASALVAPARCGGWTLICPCTECGP